jgi:hypothetical protein
MLPKGIFGIEEGGSNKRITNSTMGSFKLFSFETNIIRVDKKGACYGHNM